MKLNRPGAEIWVPDGQAPPSALERTTHIGIGAHQDDIEILAQRGILDCFDRRDRWFTAVIVTDGAGSARSGPYADYTDDEMRAVRKLEQKKAGMVGDYSAVVLLDFTSGDVKTPKAPPIVADLAAILSAARPEIVYTHNLADKHDTHVGTALRVIEACRTLPAAQRPSRVLGGEVWRDLDWMCDPDKVALDVQDRESLTAALLGVFDSQITGGKRYDLATAGRHRAHATYHQAHSLDATVALTFAMDLTPLVQSDTLDPLAYAKGYIERFAAEVTDRVRRLS
jgi:LmbE family N-acetylglucosaminyl deacetylase